MPINDLHLIQTFFTIHDRRKEFQTGALHCKISKLKNKSYELKNNL